jgi:hypothetical protein
LNSEGELQFGSFFGVDGSDISKGVAIVAVAIVDVLIKSISSIKAIPIVLGPGVEVAIVAMNFEEVDGKRRC